MKKSKVVVMSGVSRGLGRALLAPFLADGWCVAGFARTSEAIASLEREYPDRTLFRVVDVLDVEGIAEFSHETEKAFGIPKLVLNNAAVINANAPLWEVPVEEFSDVIDINLKGVFHVCRAFLPRMLVRREGVIVNFSSGWGRSVSPEVAPYCCTKWGIEGLTAALAQELPSGLAAIALNPGIICTDMLASTFGDHAKDYRSAEEWAETTAPFLMKLGAKDNGKALTAP